MRAVEPIVDEREAARSAHPPRTATRIATLAIARLGVVLAAIAAAAWIARDARFLTSDGALTGRAAFPISAVVAAAISVSLAVGHRALWPLWVGVLISGQAAALQLVEAGTTVRYQHYAPIDRLVAQPAFAGLLLLQAVIAAAWLARHTDAVPPLRSLGRVPHFAVVGAVFVLSSATLSPTPHAFGFELLFATFVQAVGALTVVAAAGAIPSPVLDDWQGALARALTSAQRLTREPAVVLAAVWVTVCSVALVWWSYGRQPHVPDEIAYLFQARYMAEGRLWLPAPPVPAAFEVDLMTHEGGRWYSLFPPGWPAVLALGVRVGADWLVNPLLGGVNLFLLFALVRRLYDEQVARTSVALMAVSPWYLFLAMSYMSHTFSLTCLLVAALGVIRARQESRPAWAWLGGVAAGGITLIRPLEGATLASVLGLWMLVPVQGRVRMGSAASFGVGVALAAALQLPYNAALAGSPFRFPLMAYFERLYGPGANALGFGADRGFGWPALDPLPGHGLLDVLINADFNTSAINVELFGWMTGSLAVLAWFVALRRLRAADCLMLALGGAVVMVHSLYWFSGGPDFGARYWYPVILPAVVLTARGLDALCRVEAPGTRTAQRVAVAVVLLSLASIASFMPWRATDKYFRYRGIRSDVRSLLARQDFGRSLILVRGVRHRDFGAAVMYNPLDLSAAAPVFAWDRNPEVRAALLRAYADRPVWILDGATRTGRGFEIAAGPFAPGAAVPADESGDEERVSK